MKISLWSTIGFLVAIGLFVTAGFLYRDSIRARYRHVWQPMSMPLPLVAGEVESPEFFAEKGIYYVIEIAPNGAWVKKTFRGPFPRTEVRSHPRR